MSKSSKSSLRSESGYIEIKSKFDAEFRRFSVDKIKQQKFETFLETVTKLHRLVEVPVTITYTDIHGDLLPINNDENFNLALVTVKPVLRIFVQRKGEDRAAVNGYGTLPVKKRNPLTKILSSDPQAIVKHRIPIGLPEDFRRVSAIIDVDTVPETHRRVKLMKNGSDKPLGFYIRDGTSVRVTPQGLEKVPGIFISRLVPGGLAESTGLLAVNDEVLEVNGIEVCGKTLDQVTDMMVANSSNLIITVKPVNQRLTLAPQRGGVGRYSQMSHGSHLSSASGHSRQSSKSYSDSDLITEQDDEDEVQDYLNKSAKSGKSENSNRSDNKNTNGENKERQRNDEGNRGSGRSTDSGKQRSEKKERRNDEGTRGSGRSTDSGKQKHDKGATKTESEGPVVTL